MKMFFDYIDPITLGLGLLISIFVAVKTWKQSGKRTRLGVLPFLFFAPVLIITSMFMHLFEVTYHVIETRMSGRFAYSFYLYSLYLLPIVLIYLSLKYYRQTYLFCLSKRVNKTDLLKTAAFIAVISLPPVKIVPIAAVPSIAAVSSLFASLFARKGQQVNISLKEGNAT